MTCDDLERTKCYLSSYLKGFMTFKHSETLSRFCFALFHSDPEVAALKDKAVIYF